jgi:hypothetical protein
MTLVFTGSADVLHFIVVAGEFMPVTNEHINE